MGVYTCEFNVVHKVCRCPTSHTISCDVPEQHNPIPMMLCLVWQMRMDGRLPMPKHLAHPPHDWWYTSSGGGHQLDHDPGNDSLEKNVRKWRCPGRPD